MYVAIKYAALSVAPNAYVMRKLPRHSTIESFANYCSASGRRRVCAKLFKTSRSGQVRHCLGPVIGYVVACNRAGVLAVIANGARAQIIKSHRLHEGWRQILRSTGFLQLHPRQGLIDLYG